MSNSQSSTSNGASTSNGDLAHTIQQATPIRKDFPKPGINFVDFLPLFANSPDVMKMVVDEFKRLIVENDIQAVAGIDARGFIFGSPVAYALSLPFVVLRKPGKTPPPSDAFRFDTEYSSDGLELQKELLQPGTRVALIDDILATGGTAEAALELLRRAGADVALTLFVGELSALNARERLLSRMPDDGQIVALVDYVE